jgi:undecaprenyl-diphosphatase
MTDLHAAVLGIVQGFSEFLPISSTAHILLVDKLFFGQDSGAAFTAVIQWGTLLATLIYFRNDIVNILFRRKPASEEDGGQTDQHLLTPIVVGTIPVVVLGLLLKHRIEHQFRSLWVVIFSMVFFAILLGIAEWMYRARRDMGSVTTKDGLLVGLAQACALIPGASRSGTTLTGAMMVGLERSTAARFSFLLSLPAVFGAGAKELWDVRHNLASAGGARPLVIATIFAFIVGWATIDWLLKFLRRHPTYVFIVYRIVLGFLLAGLLASGVIKDTRDANEPKGATEARTHLHARA